MEFRRLQLRVVRHWTNEGGRAWYNSATRCGYVVGLLVWFSSSRITYVYGHGEQICTSIRLGCGNRQVCRWLWVPTAMGNTFHLPPWWFEKKKSTENIPRGSFFLLQFKSFSRHSIFLLGRSYLILVATWSDVLWSPAHPLYWYHRRIQYTDVLWAMAALTCWTLNLFCVSSLSGIINKFVFSTHRWDRFWRSENIPSGSAMISLNPSLLLWYRIVIKQWVKFSFSGLSLWQLSRFVRRRR